MRAGMCGQPEVNWMVLDQWPQTDPAKEPGYLIWGTVLTEIMPAVPEEQATLSFYLKLFLGVLCASPWKVVNIIISCLTQTPPEHWVRGSSRLCPQPATEPRALLPAGPGAFCPRIQGCRTGRNMGLSPLALLLLLLEKLPFSSAFLLQRKRSLAKCLRVGGCCKQMALTKAVSPRSQASSPPLSPEACSNYPRFQETWIHHSVPFCPQNFILLQTSTQLKKSSCFYDWLLHYKNKPLRSICWAKLLT